jgi:hypothetical protein
MERSEVSIVFEPVDGDLFRAVRIEEEVEGHLRRARDDLGGIVIEAAGVEGESLYRIHVAADDDVAGHVHGAAKLAAQSAIHCGGVHQPPSRQRAPGRAHTPQKEECG